MNCPVCKKPLIILELEQIEIDYCVDCGGIWLDANELELLLDDETAYQRVVDSGRLLEKTRERKRKCPLCRKKMLKLEVGDTEPVTYDACPQGEGIWLDQGELEAIIRFGLPDREGSEIQRFLGNLFSGPEQMEDKTE